MKIIKYFFEFIVIISLFCIFKIIGLKNKKVRCCQSAMLFRVRVKLWPSPGTGCGESSPSLLGPIEKGSLKYETPRCPVESTFDTDIEMDAGGFGLTAGLSIFL